jgi:hypothetical protein
MEKPTAIAEPRPRGEVYLRFRPQCRLDITISLVHIPTRENFLGGEIES